MVAIAPKIQPASPMAEEMVKPLHLERSDVSEQRITYSDRTWEQFKLLEQGLEGLTGLRLFYFDGKVEILMPGRNHELFTEVIALLIQVFLLARGLEFTPTGSMTREEEGSGSAEPDKSYEFGELKLAIEVIVTSGSINKLDLYEVLGFHEVWFWEDGLLVVYHMRDDAYEKVDQSQIPELVEIQLDVLSRCILIGETSRVRACKEFLAAHPTVST
jgi:Uma2 family endonuclease